MYGKYMTIFFTVGERRNPVLTWVDPFLITPFPAFVLLFVGAYDSGRTKKDPSEGWYKGELWFFDYYVIPLAKRLEECGVFGVSCDECYSYALQNRQEWERKGKDIVQEMVESYQDVRRVR
jgi:hypothetical protein